MTSSLSLSPQLVGHGAFVIRNACHWHAARRMRPVWALWGCAAVLTTFFPFYFLFFLLARLCSLSTTDFRFPASLYAILLSHPFLGECPPWDYYASFYAFHDSFSFSSSLWAFYETRGHNMLGLFTGKRGDLMGRACSGRW